MSLRNRFRRAPEVVDENAYVVQKSALRDYLISHQWRRDGRCKKWETYKKYLNGVEHRVKFNAHYATVDSFVRTADRMGNSESDRWHNVRRMSYTQFEIVQQVETFVEGRRAPEPDRERPRKMGRTNPLSTYLPTQEDLDNEQYLERMGI